MVANRAEVPSRMVAHGAQREHRGWNLINSTSPCVYGRCMAPQLSSLGGGGPQGEIIFYPSCQPTHSTPSTLLHTRIICARTLATGSFSASAMYDSRGRCPAMDEYVSRWMLVRHSQLVVSGWPVPMYFAWRRSSSCWLRSLSA